MIITTEMLFQHNVQQIVETIEKDNLSQIEFDLDYYPDTYPDLLTWLELHPEIVGRQFVKHLINYGFDNEDTN